MNAQEMIAFVRLLIKEPDTDHYSNATILSMLNEGLSQAADRLEVKEATKDVSVLSGATSVSLPSDLLRLKAARIGTTNLPVKDATSLQQANDAWETVTGTPTNIVPLGLLEVRLYPIPDAAVTVTFDYVQAPTALTDDIGSIPELPIYAHYVPCKWAAYRLLKMDKAPEADSLLAEYTNDLAKALEEARARKPKEDITIQVVR